jgi:hypothetical protein
VSRVRLSATAAGQISARRDWWQKNRDKASELFDRELDQALERLSRSARSLPIFTKRAGRTILRYLMPGTRCHLYFEVLAEADEVHVIAAGGAQRRRPPRIRLQDAP